MITGTITQAGIRLVRKRARKRPANLSHWSDMVISFYVQSGTLSAVLRSAARKVARAKRAGLQ